MILLCRNAKELCSEVDFFGSNLIVAFVPKSSGEYDVLSNMVQFHLFNLVLAYLFLQSVEAFLITVI